jgi:hypothetical protein
MGWLRLLLLVGCGGAVGMAAATAPWKARLFQGNHSWVVDLGRHPVWHAPPSPDYESFRQWFEHSREFPRPNDGWGISIGYDPVEVGFAAVAYSWLVALVCGLLYLAVRGPRRDAVLHCSLHVAAGLAAALAACIGLWCVIGGWGPPAAPCFGVLGVVGGIFSGLASFRPSGPVPETSSDGTFG